eukprot:gene9751-11387_t
MSSSSFEFQVILLSIDTLNAKLAPIDENLPHAMLPVANRPLISYQLELLERAGFQSVLVVLNEFSQAKISPYVTEIYKGKIEVEFFVLKDQNQIGTCEILYRIRDKIRTNFIVMHGNLIADDCFIRQMADMHRSSDSSLTVLLNPNDNPYIKSATPEPPADPSFVDFIALDEKNERIIMMESAVEVDGNKISISKSMLGQFPNLSLNNNLQDAQFYIFSRWVIDLIVEDQKTKNRLLGIKRDLIPYLLACQISSHNKPLPSSISNHSQDLALSMSTSPIPFNAKANQQTKGTIKCMAYLIRDGYCYNVLNIPSYHRINKDIASGASITYRPLEPKGTKANYIDPSAQVAPTAVGPDCVIGTESVLGAKSSVKKSIIGKHCKFGQGVKIENSIIMDYANVEDGCVITGSIIGNSVHIKAKCSVKDSQVASGFHISKGNKSPTHDMREDITVTALKNRVMDELLMTQRCLFNRTQLKLSDWNYNAFNPSGIYTLQGLEIKGYIDESSSYCAHTYSREIPRNL